MKNTASRIITNEDTQDKSKVAYVRVSTIEQNEERQLEALKDKGIYNEP